jgi:hypothetical protein
MGPPDPVGERTAFTPNDPLVQTIMPWVFSHVPGMGINELGCTVLMKFVPDHIGTASQTIFKC